MARKTREQPAWTPNQIVAFNVSRARLLRGWTQEQAAEALAPYLGARLSGASFSALERSVAGGRIREVSADELLALSRAFEVPIGWFLTPPPRDDGIRLAVPDKKAGADPDILIDAILGTDETRGAWESVLLQYPSMRHRGRLRPDGTIEHLGPVDPDVHQRLDPIARMRARQLVREEFGDVEQARTVLARWIDVLGELDDPPPPEAGRRKSGRSGTR
jgi:transcriptional regulator with XRE-family HTH domain